jgi:hypothetical protein
MRTAVIVGMSVLLAALGPGCGGTMDSPAGNAAGNAAGMGGAGGTGGSGGAAGSGGVGGQSGGGSVNGGATDYGYGCEIAVCYSGHLSTESIGQQSCGGPPRFRTCTPLTPDGIVCVGLGEKCPGEDADAGSASSNDGGAAPSNDGEARSADSGSEAH